MLSESAAVAPLKPVLGVCVSFDCEPDRGTFKSERFCFESPSPASSVDSPRDDDAAGAIVLAASHDIPVPLGCSGELGKGFSVDGRVASVGPWVGSVLMAARRGPHDRQRAVLGRRVVRGRGAAAAASCVVAWWCCLVGRCGS